MKSTKDYSPSLTFQQFLLSNREKTNQSLNKVLWSCVIAGPAISIGITAGLFVDISYISCVTISLFIISLALFHHILCRYIPQSIFTSLFVLVAMDFILIYMAKVNIGIYLTYFLVPFVALLYCDKKIYFYAFAINYFMMCFSVWNISDYQSSLRNDYSSAFEWFINFTSGYTIESIVMLMTGHALSVITTSYFQRLYEDQKITISNNERIKANFDILNSMNDIYESINLIDFINNDVSRFNPLKHVIDKIPLQKKMRLKLDEELKNQIMSSQVEEFLEFTDLSTLQSRLTNQKIISNEFLSTLTGWFRIQYISLEANKEDGIPKKVIHTIQNINEQKQREESLIRISNTDQLTHLYNRRCYDDDIKKYQDQLIENDFVLLSVDLNSLKQVNDNLGHEAGDEILKGAADALIAVLGHVGKIYRTGGDEFLIILHTNQDIEKFKDQIRKFTSNWHGKNVDTLSLAVGYARKKDYPLASISDLEKKADEMMYQDKESYYIKKGINRKGQQEAYAAICKTYLKILKINLTTDSFEIIKMNMNEQTMEMGFNLQISKWLENFGNSGAVHPDDLPQYLKETNLEYMRHHFENSDKSLMIQYRRKFGNGYLKTVMELLPAPDADEHNMRLYLYVKNIE